MEHGEHPAGFMQPNSHLREHHHRDMRRLNDKADVAIYLVSRVATTDAREFLEKFYALSAPPTSTR